MEKFLRVIKDTSVHMKRGQQQLPKKRTGQIF